MRAKRKHKLSLPAVRLDQFSKILLFYFAILCSIVMFCGLAKDIYFMFVAPEYMDWASLYMFIGGIMSSGVIGYLIKSAIEKHKTGKDTDAEGLTFNTDEEGTYDVPEIP